jgi:hypothetical protein
MNGRVSLAILILASPAVGSPIIQVESRDVAGAVNKEICFDSFWNGTAYKLGSTVSLSISRRPNELNAWSDRLMKMRGRFVTHFVIKSDRGKTFVVSADSRNERVFPKAIENLQQREQIALRVAAHCEPAKVKESAKTKLIREIANEQIASLDKLAHRSRTTRIVIANVDESYPRSLIYAPATGELFTVTVTPGTGYRYRPDGPYQFGQVYDQKYIAWVKPKLLRYGMAVTLR